MNIVMYRNVSQNEKTEMNYQEMHEKFHYSTTSRVHDRSTLMDVPASVTNMKELEAFLHQRAIDGKWLEEFSVVNIEGFNSRVDPYLTTPLFEYLLVNKAA